MPYNIELAVKGDVSIAIWFGMYNMGQRLNTKPDLCYCFHTAFAQSGIERVTAPGMDVSDASLFPAGGATPRDFFMDVTLDNGPEVVDDDSDEEVDYSSDVQHWRSKWEENKIKVFGVDGHPQVHTPFLTLAHSLGVRPHCNPELRAPCTRMFRRYAVSSRNT